MKTELKLKDDSGVEINVDLDDLTPMGFQSTIAESSLMKLRDDSGRYKQFTLVVDMEKGRLVETIGQCRIHSIRRICANKSVICVRFDSNPLSVIERLSEVSNGYSPALRQA